MKIIPYTSVDGISYQSSMHDLTSVLGDPQSRRRSGIGLNEMNYGSRVFRFTEGGIMQEASVDAPILHITDKEMRFEDLKQNLLGLDSEAFECHGFLVSPKYGLAFDPDYPSWVTCFTLDGLQEWKKT